MPGFFMTVGSIAACPHQGQVKTAPVQTKVFAMGQPVITSANVHLVTACVFTVPGPKPQPCVTVQWLPVSFSTRVKILGTPVLLQPTPGAGAGLCKSADQLPQGPPTVSQVQPKVKGM